MFLASISIFHYGDQLFLRILSSAAYFLCLYFSFYVYISFACSVCVSDGLLVASEAGLRLPEFAIFRFISGCVSVYRVFGVCVGYRCLVPRGAWVFSFYPFHFCHAVYVAFPFSFPFVGKDGCVFLSYAHRAFLGISFRFDQFRHLCQFHKGRMRNG